MFGKKKPVETQSRYYAEGVQGFTGADAKGNAAKIQKRLDAGDARGWRLINMTGYSAGVAASIILVWDTSTEGT